MTKREKKIHLKYRNKIKVLCYNKKKKLKIIIINQCGDLVEKNQNRILPDNNNIKSSESRRFSSR